MAAFGYDLVHSRLGNTFQIAEVGIVVEEDIVVEVGIAVVDIVAADIVVAVGIVVAVVFVVASDFFPLRPMKDSPDFSKASIAKFLFQLNVY